MVDLSFLKKLKIELEPVVKKAGEIIMDVYERDHIVNEKSDGSPVTEADTKAEKLIVPAIKRICPDIPIISEENSDSHKLKVEGPFFLVDPLDGTKEFLKKDGKGAFTVNIALIKNEVPVFGMIHAPALKRSFSGIVGHGSVETNHARSNVITISERKKLNVIAVASASHRDKETNKWLDLNKIERTMSIGSSLKFCLLATGEADVYPRFAPTMEWDTAAGDAILRAAGGLVTNTAYTKEFKYGKKGFRNGGFIAWGKYRPQREIT